MADTVVKALKSLYEAIGGDPADVSGVGTKAGMITAIAGVVGGAAGTSDEGGSDDYPEMIAGAGGGIGVADFSLSGMFRAPIEAGVQAAGGNGFDAANLNADNATLTVEPSGIAKVVDDDGAKVLEALAVGAATLTIIAPVKGVLHKATVAITVTK